jgi:AcrR family transcriptional regulator
MSPRRAKVLGDSGDLRTHLVESAARLVAERGTTSVTTREIARAAGVSDGVLYNYFADKGELIVAGLVRRFEVVAARTAGSLPRAGDGDVEENLVAYAEALHDLVRETLPMIAGLVTEPALLHRLVDEIHRPEQGILPFLSRIGEYLVGEQQLGRLDPDTDVQATMLLLTGASSMLTAREHLRLSADATSGEVPIEAGSARELLERVTAVLMRGIAPGAGS